MKKTVIAGIAALTLGLASVGIGTGVALTQPEPVAVVEQATIVEEVQPTATPTPIETPTATPTSEPVVVEAPAPAPGPVRCPAGSYVNSSDGVNDTSCWPNVCATVTTFPDPNYPQCDVAFRP